MRTYLRSLLNTCTGLQNTCPFGNNILAFPSKISTHSSDSKVWLASLTALEYLRRKRNDFNINRSDCCYLLLLIFLSCFRDLDSQRTRGQLGIINGCYVVSNAQIMISSCNDIIMQRYHLAHDTTCVSHVKINNNYKQLAASFYIGVFPLVSKILDRIPE